MSGQARRHRAGAGQSLALFALMLPFVLMGMMAVGIDSANLFLGYRDAQSAADLAALAGARRLPQVPTLSDRDAARTTALAVAASNGFSSGVTATTPYVDDLGVPHLSQIEVEIASSVGLFFGPAIGMPSLGVSVRAVAQSEWAASGGTFPAVFASCTSGSQCNGEGNKAIDWSGSIGSIIGGMHSNCGILVGGSGNSVIGGTTYSSASGCGFSGSSMPASPAPNMAFPVSYTASSFTCDFTRSGKLELKNYYQSGTKTLRDGVYCATGSSAEIILDEGGVSGNVTLVVDRGNDSCTSGSGGKAVTISGSDFSLTAYDPSRVLIYTNVREPEIAVKISGSDGSWGGLIVAPCGQAEISGESVGTSGGGSILANRVKIGGSNVIIDSNGLDALGVPSLLRLRLLE